MASTLIMAFIWYGVILEISERNAIQYATDRVRRVVKDALKYWTININLGHEGPPKWELTETDGPDADVVEEEDEEDPADWWKG